MLHPLLVLAGIVFMLGILIYLCFIVAELPVFGTILCYLTLVLFIFYPEHFDVLLLEMVFGGAIMALPANLIAISGIRFRMNKATKSVGENTQTRLWFIPINTHTATAEARYQRGKILLKLAKINCAICAFIVLAGFLVRSVILFSNYFF